jgi:hypothetical protein
VSPLWRDEVGAYLAPHRLCLVQLGRGLRPRVGREQNFELPAGGADWTKALETLEQQLTEPQWRAARLRVVVCDHWARYALVPWQAGLSNLEQLAHGREVLSSLYGDVLQEWVVTLSEGLPGTARVACALPSSLIESLGAIGERRGLPLSSLQPQLMAAYNGWRHRLPAAPAWFVSLEPGSLAAVRIGEHGLERIDSVRIGQDWQRELRRLQTFARWSNDAAQGDRIYVDGPRSWSAAVRGAAETLQWLEDEIPPLTTLHRLMLCRRVAA